jgi:hypothetical protein
MLRPVLKDQHRFLSYSYLIVEPAYLVEMALSNGISRQLNFIPTFATADPLLHEITAALTTVPAVPDPAENFSARFRFVCGCSPDIYRRGAQF